MSLGSITLSFGATSVTLLGVQATTVYADREKNYSEYVLQNGDKVFDEAPNTKREWILRHDPPLTAQEDADLETLCYTHGRITLTESWVENGTYQVYFRKLRRSLETPNGQAHYDIELAEL